MEVVDYESSRMLCERVGEKALTEASDIFDKNGYAVTKCSDLSNFYEIRNGGEASDKVEGTIGFCARQVNNIYVAELSMSCQTKETLDIASSICEQFDGIGKSNTKVRLVTRALKRYVDDSEVDEFFKKG